MEDSRCWEDLKKIVMTPRVIASGDPADDQVKIVFPMSIMVDFYLFGCINFLELAQPDLHLYKASVQ